MASSFVKTFFFILYGVITFLLLCAVLVLILKDDKSSCGTSPLLSKEKLDSLLRDVNDTNLVSGSSPQGTTMDFTGVYELTSSENFDEFLSEMGIGYFTRMAATRASSKYYITKDNDTYTLRTVSTFGESSITFKNGEHFREDRLDGENVDSVINIKDNKWVQKQTLGEQVVTIIREFTPEEIIVTSMINNVASVRKYKKIE